MCASSSFQTLVLKTSFASTALSEWGPEFVLLDDEFVRVNEVASKSLFLHSYWKLFYKLQH